MFSRIDMKKLLLIANRTRLAELVHKTASRARVAVVQVTSCRVMNDLLMHRCDFDMVIVELRPCLSRLALLTEIQDRFEGLPVLAVTGSDDPCENALACAYADCTPVRAADLDDESLSRRLRSPTQPGVASTPSKHRTR